MWKKCTHDRIICNLLKINYLLIERNTYNENSYKRNKRIKQSKFFFFRFTLENTALFFLAILVLKNVRSRHWCAHIGNRYEWHFIQSYAVLAVPTWHNVLHENNSFVVVFPSVSRAVRMIRLGISCYLKLAILFLFHSISLVIWLQWFHAVELDSPATQ